MARKVISILVVIAMAATMIFLGVTTVTARPSEVWVDDDAGSGPGDMVDGHIFGTDAFAKIQDGIDAVGSPGMVHVAAGTYTENVDVNKSLTIQSESGAEATIVQAANSDDHVFEITAGSVNIAGFTVKGAVWPKAGIYLGSNVARCNVSSNTATDNQFGIYLDHSSDSTLTGNNATNSEYGIYLESTSNTALTSNDASNSGVGILLLGSSGNTLTGNTASNNGAGIMLYYSSHNSLTGNRMSDNQWNFGLDGWELSHFTQNIDTSNKVNGRPIYYLVDEKDRLIDSTSNAGYVGLVNCANTTVRDLTLIDNGQGVLLAHCSDSRIEGVDTSNNGHGMYLYDSFGNTLIDNTHSWNYWSGIFLWDSSHNTLAGNTASLNGGYGICLYDSSDNTLMGNSANSNGESGILLYYGSSRNIMMDNRADSNKWVGIGLEEDCFNNTLTGTTASNNWIGVYLDGSSDNLLTRNTASGNEYGIRLRCSSNTIHFNNFIDNYVGNADSHYSTNTWSSPEEITYTYCGKRYTNYLGNHWSDYKGSDADGDGIGDIPYSVDSDADNYPLVQPFEDYEYVPNRPPVADAGLDQRIYVTSPATMAEVTLDGSGSYDPDGDPLTYAWTWDCSTAAGVDPIIELPLGTTTITLVVNDGELYSDPDTVDITVEQRAKLHADFSATPAKGVAPLTVHFTDESTGGVEPYTYEWDFGDGIRSTASNPSYTYRHFGKFTVTLTVTDTIGNIDKAETNIFVLEPYVPPEPAQFSASHLYISPPQVLPNQQVEISINIANCGGETSSYTVPLYINGNFEDSCTVSVSPGSTQNVVLTVTKATPGTYKVSLEGEEGQFTVIARPRSYFPGELGAGGIVLIAVVTMVLIAAIALIFSRARKM